MSPSNVHESQHPVLKVKVSQLRNGEIGPRQVRTLTNEIATILAVEASQAVFDVRFGQMAVSAFGYEFHTELTHPQKYSIVPVLRSGLAMLEGKVFAGNL
jgi:uracil phosphoribosyltransferase